VRDMLRKILFVMACCGLSEVSAQPTDPAMPIAVPTIPKALPSPIPAPPSLSAKSYLLVEYSSGLPIVSHNADQRLEPASTTKIMVSYVIFHELKAGRLKLEDQIHISDNAWKASLNGDSRMFLNPGSDVSVKDLLLGLIVQSGNDAAIALAEHVAGTESAFAELMNQYAMRLGMSHSHFTNAPGNSDPGHYTTAADLALLSRALIREFPEFYPWYSIKEFTYNKITQPNRNALLSRDPSVDGIKTGHTENAGYCLVSSAKRGDMRLISVLMGAPAEKNRNDESAALINYGYRFFELHQLYGEAAAVTTRVIWKGVSSELKLGLSEPLRVIIPRGSYERLSASMELPSRLIAPVAKAQKLGVVRIKLDGKVIVERPLIALDDVATGGVFKRMSDGFWMWWRADDGT
jgi:serine-type D-Ala-D-Ala carboxypeptidase (penicillin-binding protein 5/6)